MEDNLNLQNIIHTNYNIFTEIYPLTLNDFFCLDTRPERG